MISLSAKLLSC